MGLMSLAADDIVKWYTRTSSWTSNTHFGIVTDVTTKGGVTVRYLDRSLQPHGEPIKFRANARNLPTKATDLDIARLRWLAKRPHTSVATMQFRFGAGDADPPDCACVNQSRLTSPEGLRKAAADLVKLAEWWEKMPTLTSLALAAGTEH